MKQNFGILAASLVAVLSISLLAGCSESPSTAQANARDKGFVDGAFPPTLSNKEYHTNSWSRTDCLKCHEAGLQDAPKIKHVSVPELAIEAKCRTCHVTVADSGKAP